MSLTLSLVDQSTQRAHIYFSEIPFHVQSFPLAFLLEYDSSCLLLLTVLLVLIQKLLPFLLFPKYVNLALKWMDQNC